MGAGYVTCTYPLLGTGLLSTFTCLHSLLTAAHLCCVQGVPEAGELHRGEAGLPEAGAGKARLIDQWTLLINSLVCQAYTTQFLIVHQHRRRAH